MKNVDTSSERSGYPRGCGEAFTSDSLNELKEVLENEGGELVVLTRRAGQHFYYNTGTFPYDNLTDGTPGETEWYLKTDASNSEEDILNLVIGEYESLTEWLHNCYPNIDSFDDLKELIDKTEAFISEIEDCVKAEGKTLIVIDMDNQKVDYSIGENDTSFSEDVTTHQLALIKPEEEED